MNRLVFNMVFYCILISVAGCRHIAPSKEDSSTRLKDVPNQPTGEKEGTYEWQYGHHAIHTFVFDAEGIKLTIATVLNDEDGDGRNTRFGGRPALTYHKVTLKNDPDQEITFAKWPDELTQQDYTYVYCRSIYQIKEYDKRSYPADLLSFAEDFGLKSPPAISACQIKVNKPELRPNPEGSMYPTHAEDVICIFSPKAEMGQGPEFVGIYLPYKYYPKGFFHPMERRILLHEWPELNGIKMCIDGKIIELAGSPPPKVN